MADNITLKDVVLDKKLDGYGSDGRLKDFVSTQELTVTITLAEYRELVGSQATKKADIDAAEKNRYSREQEIKNLTEANNALKAENYELKKIIDDQAAQIAAQKKEKEDYSHDR